MRPVEQLINEVRLLYQSLVQIGEAIHADSKVSMGMRAVLEYLDRNGDATVPDVARARRVSRQRIQTLVNPLLEMDLAESISNPASKRSPLITLTTNGTKTILEMRRREGRQMHLAMSETKIGPRFQ
jgi:DNA-binding MarR family transcriptional regulator